MTGSAIGLILMPNERPSNLAFYLSRTLCLLSGFHMNLISK